MSSSDGESIFLTQSKFKDDNENHPNTDGVLSDILDMEAGPDFDLIQNCVFSDISDEDMINASQEVESIDRFLKPLNQQDLDDLIRSGLSKKTESKSKWALNLFASWQQERKKKQPNTDVYMYKNIMNMQDDEIDKCLRENVDPVKFTLSREIFLSNLSFEILKTYVDNRWNLDLNTIFLIPQKYKTAFGLFSTRV